ncbi:DNA-directed RNA polymerase [Bacillus tianshenii]|uniref:DNA-directed RNA polymerase n=2 Tax=Sutcliffiella tianshenii TaxID=1463404 RepID=A0ABS2P3E4_9BACI|nr:DNA-directed RNA polymerase [Bacillus tianshenii]
MIHHIIHSLHIYKNQEYYLQEGMIALWEATVTFKAEKGAFTSYAYSTIRGKLLNYLKKEIRFSSAEEPSDETRLASIPYHESTIREDLEAYTQNLTENQRKWLVEYIINNKKIEEIARETGSTASAVKSWRRGALRNIKKMVY